MQKNIEKIKLMYRPPFYSIYEVINIDDPIFKRWNIDNIFSTLSDYSVWEDCKIYSGSLKLY